MTNYMPKTTEEDVRAMRAQLDKILKFLEDAHRAESVAGAMQYVAAAITTVKKALEESTQAPRKVTPAQRLLDFRNELKEGGVPESDLRGLVSTYAQRMASW